MRRAALFRLDVDVAGPLVGGLDEDFVDQLDDAGFLGHLGRFAVVGLEAFEQLDLVGALLHHGGDGFAADAEVRLDEPGDLARTGQHRLDLQAGEHLQFVEGVDVVRVAGGDDEGAVVARQRHEGAAVDELERHGLERVRLDLDLGQVDQLHAELLGQRGEDVFFLGEAAFDEQLMERLGGGREMGLGNPRQFGCREDAASDQALDKLHAVLGRARGCAGDGGPGG